MVLYLYGYGYFTLLYSAPTATMNRTGRNSRTAPKHMYYYDRAEKASCSSLNHSHVHSLLPRIFRFY